MRIVKESKISAKRMFGMWKRGKSLQEIGAAAGLTGRMVQRHIKTLKKKAGDAAVREHKAARLAANPLWKKISRLRAKGLGAGTISKQLGIHKASVHQYRVARGEKMGPCQAHVVRCGEAHRNSRLTADDILECRRRSAAGESSYTLADEFGISAGAMRHNIAGTRWKSVA